MSDIAISKAVRQNLGALQNTAQLLSTSQERLSTGLRVNSAIDNPTNYFTAQGLNSRASDLKQLQDGISTSVSTIQEADKGIRAIGKLLDSAKGIVAQAKSGGDTASLNNQLKEISKQIKDLAEDASINGVNLLKGDKLSVKFNEKTGEDESKLDIVGEDLTGDAFGLDALDLTTKGTPGTPAVSDDPATPADETAAAVEGTPSGADKAGEALTAASEKLEGAASKLGSQLAIVETRKDFNRATIDTLQNAAGDLTLADLNEEGANVSALQTRQQIAGATLGIAARADQSVLGLLR